MTHVHFIIFRGKDLRVEYDYQPEEKAVMYYSDGSGYPGCAESFEITKVTLIEGAARIDVTELCEAHFDAIEQQIIDEASDWDE